MTKRHLRNAIPALFVGMALLVTVPIPAGADVEGRWKIDGSGCVFDPNDEGPNQCSPTGNPQQPGRWKIDGSGCVFDPNDGGPDQCSPSGAPEPGRWKLDGAGGCYFDSTDSGPNQCVPTE